MAPVALEPVGSFEFYLNASLAFCCVCVAGMAAGLTMGLLAIEPFRLQILLESRVEDCTSGRQARQLEKEQNSARKILPIVTKHHRLLVTLLLLNSLANECLPIFLDEVVPTSVAILLSVTLVLIFGEIVPSAIFTGPNQIEIAATLVPLVNFCMFVLYPIAAPIAWMLDQLLGEEHDDRFNKAELRALVKLHTGPSHKKPSHHQESHTSRAESAEIRKKLELVGVDGETAAMAALATTAAKEALIEEDIEFQNEWPEPGTVSVDATDPQRAPLLSNSPTRTLTTVTDATAAGLHTDEVMIMHGALDLKETYAEDKMIPLGQCFMIQADAKLTENVLADIVAAGHSRVLVYDGHRSNIRGLLLVKKLIVINPNDKRQVDSLFLRAPIYVRPSTSLLVLLNLFQSGHSHMAVVTDDPERMGDAISKGEPVPDDINVFGLCTLEDIIETLIKEDIVDETDFNHSVKHNLFTEQRKRRLTQIADAQLRQRKLGRMGTAALRGTTRPLLATSPTIQSRSSYGSIVARGSTDLSPIQVVTDSNTPAQSLAQVDEEEPSLT